MAAANMKLNEKSVEKKLMTVTNTQDSIQSLSLWILHHKANHEKIVDLWFEVLKKAQIRHRLTLFYLCNEVVQTSKRKQATIYIGTFKNILKAAVVFVRDPAVKSSVGRIFNIWSERGVFSKNFVTELQGLLVSTVKPKPVVNAKILAEFKPQQLLENMRSFRKCETDIEPKLRQASQIRVDTVTVDAIASLKDKKHGKEIGQMYEEWCVKLRDSVRLKEQQIRDRQAMIEMLQKGELFYEEQYKEARIVVNAYKVFGNRINNLKKKLDDLKMTLPDPLSPCPSPSMDAPSPGNTPPNNETVDMELGDSDGEETDKDKSVSGRIASTYTTGSVSYPILSLTQITMHSQGSNTLENRIANMLPNMALGASSAESRDPRRQTDTKSSDVTTAAETTDAGDGDGDAPAADHSPDAEAPSYSPVPGAASYSPVKASTTFSPLLGSASYSPSDPSSNSPPPTSYNPVKALASADKHHLEDADGSTPVKDEGSATPVLDEPEEAAPETDTKHMASPIDFLTQLITQSKTTSKGSSFLQNLSKLTDVVKSNVDDMLVDTTVEDIPKQPSSWKAWKEKQIQETPPAPEAPVIEAEAAVPASPPEALAQSAVLQPPIPPPLTIPPPVHPSQIPSPIPQPALSRPPMPPQILSPHGFFVPPPSHPPPPPTWTSPPPGFPSPAAFPPQFMPQPDATPPKPAKDYAAYPYSTADATSPTSPSRSPAQGYAKTPGSDPESPIDPVPYTPSQPYISATGPRWPAHSDPSNLKPSVMPLSASLTNPSPPKGILRNSSRNVLKEVPLASSSPDDISASVSSIQTIESRVGGTHHPKPPSQPPSPDDDRLPPKFARLLSGPVPVKDDQKDFIEKLKRKTSGNLLVPNIIDVPTGSGSTGSNRNSARSNIITLSESTEEELSTEVDDGEMDPGLSEDVAIDLDDEHGDGVQMEGSPVTTIHNLRNDYGITGDSMEQGGQHIQSVSRRFHGAGNRNPFQYGGFKQDFNRPRHFMPRPRFDDSASQQKRLYFNPPRPYSPRYYPPRY